MTTNHPQRSGERVTIINLDGEAERVTLPAPFWHGSATGPAHSTGVWITGLYLGPRTGRMFRRSRSIWDRGDGATVGTTYRELTGSEFLTCCELVGVDPPDQVAAPDV